MVGFLAKEPSASWRPFTTWITVWGVQSCLQNVFRVIDVVCPETEFGSSFPDKFVRVQESRGNFSFEVKEMRVVRDILFEKVLTFSASYLRRTRELQVVSLPRKLECKKRSQRRFTPIHLFLWYPWLVFGLVPKRFFCVSKKTSFMWKNEKNRTRSCFSLPGKERRMEMCK